MLTDEEHSGQADIVFPAPLHLTQAHDSAVISRDGRIMYDAIKLVEGLLNSFRGPLHGVPVCDIAVQSN